MDEADVLVPDYFDLVDRAELGADVSQVLLVGSLFEITNKHVPRCLALGDSLDDGRWHRRGFAPSNLELLTMQGEFLHRRVRMESSGGRAVQEGDEDARFLGQELDAFNRTESNEVEQLVNRRLCAKISSVPQEFDEGHTSGEIAHIDGSSSGVSSCSGSSGGRGGSVVSSHSVGVHGRGHDWRARVAL